MSMKQAAEELLKIADEIEKDAAEVTEFVCDKCNHTATLAQINAKRTAAAENAKVATGKEVTINAITVNDKVRCAACDGVMSYKPTEASEAYYYDPDKKADDDKEEKEEKKEDDVEKTASIDYDSLEKYMAK